MNALFFKRLRDALMEVREIFRGNDRGEKTWLRRTLRMEIICMEFFR